MITEGVKEDAEGLLTMAGISEPHDPARKNLQYADNKALHQLIVNIVLTDEYKEFLDYLRS